MLHIQMNKCIKEWVSYNNNNELILQKPTYYANKTHTFKPLKINVSTANRDKLIKDKGA